MHFYSAAHVYPVFFFHIFGEKKNRNKNRTGFFLTYQIDLIFWPFFGGGERLDVFWP